MVLLHENSIAWAKLLSLATKRRNQCPCKYCESVYSASQLKLLNFNVILCSYFPLWQETGTISAQSYCNPAPFAHYLRLTIIILYYQQVQILVILTQIASINFGNFIISSSDTYQVLLGFFLQFPMMMSHLRKQIFKNWLS